MGSGKFVLLSVLSSRLYYLQVLEADKYKTMAEGNRVRLYPILPSRGKILDRNGVILAEGNPRYQVVFDPPNKKNDEHTDEVIKKVSELLGFDEEKLNKLEERIFSKKNNDLILVDDYLPWDNVAKIEVHAPELPGISIMVPEVRNYPYGKTTAHIIGYTGLPSKDDLEKSVLYKNPEFKIGKTGLEKSLEERLQGKAGVKQIEVNALGAQIRELETDDGVPGEDIELTLDIELQKFVEEKLTGKGGLATEGGSVVVLDVKTGGVLSMVSLPSYDTNQFVRGVKSEYWKELMENPDSPLSNKCISLHYPPGSTFKTIVALAALEEGVITKKTMHRCPGYYDFGGRRFHCWNRDGHGAINIETAIMQSCNVFFYKLSRELGVDSIAKWAKKFGFGDVTGIEIPGEKPGLVASREWKLKTKGEPWYQGETLNTSIGQGFTLATPLQLAVATARLASGGKKVVPHIVKENMKTKQSAIAVDGNKKTMSSEKEGSFEQIKVNQKNIKLVLRGMDLVVNDKRGLVYLNRIKDREHAFAGKTGTAQVLSDRTFKYIPKNKAERYHSLFIGFSPVDNPRYALSVVVEHGGYGSSVAAPIGRDIFNKIHELEDKT